MSEDVRAFAAPAFPIAAADLVAVAAALLVCITLHPFESLATSASVELTSGRDGMTYALFTLLIGSGFALAWPTLQQAARPLLSWPLLAVFGWFALSCLVSPDHASSVKRLVLAAMIACLGALLVILPVTIRRLAAILAVATAVVLILSYGGVMLVPDLAVHQITDLGEPELAGDWRGVFAHKNDAAGVLSIFIFQGLFVARRGFAPAGWAIVAASAVFMYFAEGKSALALGVLTVVISQAWRVMPDRWPRIVMMLMPVILLNLIGLGSIAIPPIQALVHALPIDATFTGRDGIWAFGLNSLPGHLLLGHGFDGFWNTEATRFGGDELNWAASANHAHNSYLDAALSGGLPGLALVLIAFLYQPLRDLRVADREGADPAFLSLLMQTWLFGLYLSAFETVFFHRADPIWLFFLFAVAGLRLAATFRLKIDEEDVA